MTMLLLLILTIIENPQILKTWWLGFYLFSSVISSIHLQLSYHMKDANLRQLYLVPAQMEITDQVEFPCLYASMTLCKTRKKC